MSDTLPTGWAQIELGNHVYIAGRIGWRGLKAEEYIASGPIFLSVPNLNHGDDVNFGTVYHIPQEHYDESPEIQLKVGDTLLVKDGAGIGKLGFVATLPGKATVNSSLLVVRPNDSLLEERFLFYYLKGPQFQNIALERISGSATPHLFQKDIKFLRVLVPPRVEQRRIVHRLDALLARVRTTQERLDRIPAVLKRFRQAVLAAAFDGRLTAGWRKRNDRSETGAAFLEKVACEKAQSLTSRDGRQPRHSEVAASDESELPSVPDGWVWSTVEALSTKVVDGVHKKPNYVPAGVPFLSVRNLTAGPGISFAKTSFIRREDHEEFIRRANPERGDILITKDGTLGVVRVVDCDKEFSIFVSLALVKPAVRTSGPFLALALSSPQIQQRIVVTGTGLQHIHLRDLRAVQVPIPPESEQREIVRQVNALFALAERLRARYEVAENHIDNLTRSILSRAFRGGLVPTEAELAIAEGRSYETVAELLAKLQMTQSPTHTAKRRGKVVLQR